MSRSIPTQTPTGAPAVIAAPADGSDNPNNDVSALLAEVATLRQRLAALEQRSPAAAPAEPPPGRRARPRPSRKTVARLTIGATLAMLAGASVVYGQTAVDALFISKEGDVAIGSSGGLFVGKAGNVAIGPSRFVSSGYKLLVSTPEPKTKVSTSEAAGLAVTTNEADNPFGLGIRLKGAPALADRSAVLQTTDLNLADGGRLLLQPIGGNVGIGTYTPNAGNKLEVNGKIAAQSLNTLDQSVKIEGSGGRNLFSDEEKAGNLRVGGVSNTPGIYSDKGDVIIASQSNNVWLRGKVAISTEADAKTRNQPETLYVDGGIKATGTVVGNIKTRLQVNNEAEKTSTKPNWRYHITLTAGDVRGGAKTQTIPRDVLIALCGEPDGCNAIVGRRLWSVNETTTWSNTFHFVYNKDTQGFRSDDPFKRDGSTVNGKGVVRAGEAPGGYCFLTNETVVNNQFMNDKGAGMQLLLDRGDRPERGCELTLIP
jgi:hypothetical protein